jgi:hypothetical protein
MNAHIYNQNLPCKRNTVTNKLRNKFILMYNFDDFIYIASLYFDKKIFTIISHSKIDSS